MSATAQDAVNMINTGDDVVYKSIKPRQKVSSKPQQPKTLVHAIREFTNTRKVKKTAINANHENIIIPFLHGAQIKNRRFASYVFVLHTKENYEALVEREFTVDHELDLSAHDDIFKIGTIMYNQRFNLIIELIKESDWVALNASIDIAETSVKQLNDQCKVLLTAFETISKIQK